VKKGLVIVLAVLMVIGLTTAAMAMSDSQVFKFKCKVQKYIEVNPAYNVVKLGGHIPGYAVNPGYDGGEWTATINDAIYANCGFSFAVSGNNPAGDGIPILVREEEINGTGNGHYDYLKTWIILEYYVNNGDVDPGGEYPEHYHIWCADRSHWDPDNGWDNDMNIPVPHNGEVTLKVTLKAGLPHTSPDFANSNTWDQSADAGKYSAWVNVTYTAL